MSEIKKRKTERVTSLAVFSEREREHSSTLQDFGVVSIDDCPEKHKSEILHKLTEESFFSV